MAEALVRVPAIHAGVMEVARQVLPPHPDAGAGPVIHAHGTTPIVNTSGWRDVPWMDGQIRCRATSTKSGEQCKNYIDPSAGLLCLSHVQAKPKVSYKEQLAATLAAKKAAEDSANEG